MNLFHVNFEELYGRHLCRHSQFGLNVLHLVAVIGIYFSLFGIALALPGGQWIVACALGAYFLVLTFNIPVRVLLANVLMVGGVLAGFLSVPSAPVWVYVVLLFVWHQFQVWQHRIYDRSLDMTEFAEKYRKGLALFVTLAFYEMPILLNFLVFDGRNRTYA